jgi:hypothetical protein
LAAACSTPEPVNWSASCGYRTAKLSLPGAADQSVDLPIAGETTVI